MDSHSQENINKSIKNEIVRNIMFSESIYESFKIKMMAQIFKKIDEDENIIWFFSKYFDNEKSSKSMIASFKYLIEKLNKEWNILEKNEKIYLQYLIDLNSNVNELKEFIKNFEKNANNLYASDFFKNYINKLKELYKEYCVEYKIIFDKKEKMILEKKNKKKNKKETIENYKNLISDYTNKIEKSKSKLISNVLEEIKSIISKLKN